MTAASDKSLAKVLDADGRGGFRPTASAPSPRSGRSNGSSALGRTARLKRNRTLSAVLAVVVSYGCASSPETPTTTLPHATAHPEPTSSEPAPADLDPAATARLEWVRRSIEQGLDVDEADAGGRTPLMMAAFEGITEVVALLLEHGAELDRRDEAGRTALMYASSGPFQETVELLVRNGAEIDAADTAEGWTALMFAAAEGHQPVVETLLRLGANPSSADQDGETAIDHARQRGQTHIVALLESRPEGR